MKLLAVGNNAKTIKGDKSTEYLTAIMYLAPHKLNSSSVNLCPHASDGCIAACLNTAGRGAFTRIQDARQRKADYFVRDREAFLEQLHKEILRHSMNARLAGKKPAVRLNGTSDIPWERYIDFSLYPEVQFYDYTKSLVRILNPSRPDNYHLTFSRDETTTDKIVKKVCLADRNVAVVFDNELPETYLGFKVIDGDKHDLRFLDLDGVIVGLSAKGKAKNDDSGFVVKQEENKDEPV